MTIINSISEPYWSFFMPYCKYFAEKKIGEHFQAAFDILLRETSLTLVLREHGLGGIAIMCYGGHLISTKHNILSRLDAMKDVSIL